MEHERKTGQSARDKEGQWGEVDGRGVRQEREVEYGEEEMKLSIRSDLPSRKYSGLWVGGEVEAWHSMLRWVSSSKLDV